MAISEKRKAINTIFEQLYTANPGQVVYKFNNNKVKQVTGNKFSNQFDATKFDSYDKLPELLKKHGYFIIHIGQGNHAFIKGNGFHKFENITKRVSWPRSKSYIDAISDSEAQSVSTAFNDKIIHDFLTNNKNSKILVHTARRSRTSYDLTINNFKINIYALQIEIDGIYETDDTIATVEVKNQEHEDFEIRQLFSASKYFLNLKKMQKIPSNVKIRHLFMIRNKMQNYFKIYEYAFANVDDPNSIYLVDCKRYNY